MKIKWLGHATFLISSNDGLNIITDPYTSGAFGGVVGYSPIKDKANIVTISHEHDDHNAVSSVTGNPLVVRASSTAMGIQFVAIPMYHDEQKGAQRGKNAVFVFSIDNIKIAHLGDLGHLPSDSELMQMQGINILFLPVGGVFTIGPKQAAELVGKIKPNIVIPMHYKTNKLGFQIANVDEFLATQNNIIRTNISEQEFVADTLPQETAVYVLEPAN